MAPFDTKFTTIVQIEPILQNSEDPKIDKILNLEQVYFLMTRVNYMSILLSLGGSIWFDTYYCVNGKGSNANLEWISLDSVAWHYVKALVHVQIVLGMLIIK